MDKFTSRKNEPDIEELPVFNGEEIPVFDPVEFEQSLNEDDDADEDGIDDDDEDIDVNNRPLPLLNFTRQS